MHPAFSVIFLTTLIGAGQGLFLALYTGQLYGALDLIPGDAGVTLYGPGSVLALLLLALGLFASFFHLGHPERAWRAAACWRTSWLSREVILLPLFMGLLAMWGGLHAMGWDPVVARVGDGVEITLTLVLGGAATVACFLLYLCTAMIYASLKFIREWASSLTVLNFVLLGGASGFVLATAQASWSANALQPFFARWAVLITLAAFAVRAAALLRNRRLRPKSTVQSAIGVRHTRITQRSKGFVTGSFNTREFFHGRSAATVRAVRWLFLLLIMPVPVLLLGVAEGAALAVVAFALQYAGLLAERWFFFAEANHPQNLYYRALG